MRKAIYRGSGDEGRALFVRAPVVHLATTNETGDPILRSLHGVLEGDALYFHGAPAGEKMAGIGRTAVVSVEEVVASIPSWFVDPVKACPATTYYVSAQAHGVIEEVDDLDEKARALALLMAKYQPEGGYAPIVASDPLYRKAIAGLLVARVRIDTLDCKTKLGQNRSPEERRRILEHLWQRGRPEDVRAIAFLLERWRDVATPSFLAGAPVGVSLEVACPTDDAIALLDGAYWLVGVPDEDIRRALEHSTAIVAARDAEGSLLAFARALSDGKTAWIYDVIVAERARSTGVGGLLMKLLLDHPAVRTARHVRLTTRDAMRFYQRLGFCDLAGSKWRPWPVTDMIRFRPSERETERRAGVSRTDGRDDARLA